MNKEQIEKFWEDLSSKLNASIGKLTVPVMMGGHSELTKEVHQELIDTANWIDETLEELIN